jgi:hypothetical protein
MLQQIGQEDNAAAGDLDVLDDLTLAGAGAESTTIDAKRPDGITASTAASPTTSSSTSPRRRGRRALRISSVGKR